MKKLLSLFLLCFGYFWFISFVYAGCDPNIKCENVTLSAISDCSPGDTQTIGNKCAETLSNLSKAAQPSRDQLNKMNTAIAAFQARIKQIEADVAAKTQEIAEGEKELEASLALASERIRQFYMRSYSLNPMYLLLSATNIGSALRTIGYQQAAVNQDKKIITQTAVSVKDLEDKKSALVTEEANLESLKTATDQRAASVRQLLAQVDAYAGQLQSALSAVTARQNEFLAAKLSGLGIPLFAMSGGGCSSDLTNGKNPGFSPGFGFFTFGVPNRVGLNQYGALGRAKAGQDYETILRAYYNFDEISHADAQIRVDGYDTYSLDNYVKRVYEVPDSWTDNNLAALKAQAIAVRSYALAYTNNGAGSICTTQQCQVFKPDEKGGNWNQAVDATAGLVMKQGGSPVKAFFSSTHGGYAFNTGDIGWSSTSYTKRVVDTTSGSVSSFDDLKNNAYDKDSPWFYCDWGGRSAYSGTAWLKPDEVADIVNVYMLAQKDSSTRAHLYQTDKSNPDSNTETWDAGRVRSELGSDAFNTINDISVDWDQSTGRVTQVHVSGDAGTKMFDAGGDQGFIHYFNLRAPSNIQIVGPLFNVEKR